MAFKEETKNENNIMSALLYKSHARSAALEVGKVEVPRPLKNELLLKVIAFSVNPIDVKLLENPLRTLKLPHIPGRDFTAQVVNHDQCEDSRYQDGDIVFGMTPDMFANGCACEYIAIGQEHVALCPRGIDPVLLAGVGLVGLTVVQSMEPYLQRLARAGDSTQGKRVLIPGACGGVGSFAVQYAKSLNFHVIAIVSTNHLRKASDLGADDIIDRSAGDWMQNEKCHGVDLVLDAFSYANRAKILSSECHILGPRATYVDIASSPHILTDAYEDPLRLCVPEAAIPYFISATFLKVFIVLTNWYERIFKVRTRAWRYIGPTFAHANGRQLREVRKLVAKGGVSPVALIDKVYPFTVSGCRAAFDHIFKGHACGKVVVEVSKKS